MEDFEKRMVIEYHELDDRTNKLYTFLNDDANADKRKSISEDQLEMMHRQLWAMNAYREALSTRLQMQGVNYLNELKCGLDLFKELPHINSHKIVVTNGWGYVPNLYHFDGSWVVDWLHSEDGDSLVSFSADTPEEAIEKAWEFCKAEVIWGDFE